MKWELKNTPGTPWRKWRLMLGLLGPVALGWTGSGFSQTLAPSNTAAPRRMVITETEPPRGADQDHSFSLPTPADPIPPATLPGPAPAQSWAGPCGCAQGMISSEVISSEVIIHSTVIEPDVTPSAGMIQVPIGASNITVNECAECKAEVAKLSAELQQAVQQLVELHKQPMPYEEHAKAIREQLDKMNALSEQRTKALQQLRNASRNHNKQLQAVNTKLDAVQSSVDSAATKLDAQGTKLDHQSEKLDAVTTKIDAIAQTLGGGGDLLQRQDRQLADLAGQLGKLREQVQQLDERVREFTEQKAGSVVKRLEKSIEESARESEKQSDQQSENTNKRLGQLQDRLDEALKQLDRIGRHVKESAEKLEELDKE
jgi:DNA repair ATPase RecN